MKKDMWWIVIVSTIVFTLCGIGLHEEITNPGVCKCELPKYD